MRGNNIVTAFFETAKQLNDLTCVHYKHDNEWKTLTWAEVMDLVHQYARGLISMGVQEGTPVAILSGTRMEWTLADIAILAVGGVVVPIYPNLPIEHIGYILKDSGARIVIVENDAMLACLKEAAGKDVSYEVIILQIEGGGHYEGTTTTRALIERGNACPTGEVDRRAAAITLDKPASYIYTSGTTGVQKGAIVTHENIYAVTEGTHDLVDFKADEICLLCLPFAHVLGRMTQFYVLTKGCQAAYAESIDKLAQNYREIGPHFVVGVPRMLEKALERIEAVLARQSPFKRKLYSWAKGVAIRAAEVKQRHEKPSGFFAVQYAVAKKLVFSKLIARMGGRFNTFVSGGAPLSDEIAKFFTGVGVQVLEGYGLTETFAAMSANRADDFCFGTVGKPVKGVEIKLANDGEIMVTGPTVFKGYLNKPEATDEAFEGAWFKTGDIGEFSEEGFLRITDRKKDIIVTAGGKNIAPQRIEAVITESPYINHAMVYGDKRKYLTALVTLNPEAIKEFAQEEGIMFSRQDEMADNPSVRELIDKVIAEQNKKLARFETIKRFAIVPTDFTTETGEITPTMKVRRKFVTQKYHDMLDRLYQET